MVLLIWWMMWHCRQCIMHCTFMMQAMVVDQCLAYTGLWAEQRHAQHDKQAAQVLSLLMIMSRLTDQSDWWFISGGVECCESAVCTLLPTSSLSEAAATITVQDRITSVKQVTYAGTLAVCKPCCRPEINTTA